MTYQGMLPFYGTEDLEGVKKLYHDVLGFESAVDQGTCLVFKMCEGGYLGFCTHMEKVANPKSVMISVLTEDVDGVSRLLDENGYEAYKKPGVYAKFNIYQAFHTDCNGYTLEIMKFL